QKVLVTCEQIEIKDQVHFDTNKDTIKKESFELLDEVASVLNTANHIKRIRVEGHTDSRGKADYNLDLSKRRAASVLKYLTDKGVEASRIESEGYGVTKPI